MGHHHHVSSICALMCILLWLDVYIYIYIMYLPVPAFTNNYVHLGIIFKLQKPMLGTPWHCAEASNFATGARLRPARQENHGGLMGIRLR